LSVADGRLTAFPDAENAEHRRDRDDGERRPPFSDAGEPMPHAPERAAPPLDTRAVGIRAADIGHQHGQQDEIGQDDDGHADARGDGHLANHLNGNQQDGDEADQVRQQRHNRG
jgi:hypothetical protein